MLFDVPEREKPLHPASPGTRHRPMKILVLGMCRTGTSSLKQALQDLGFHPYDYPDRYKLGHIPLWTDAVRAKYHGGGTSWGRDEFDKLTGDFDVILDTPCCLLVDELTAAYPDAKIILSTRDADKWMKSMQNTLFTAFNWPSWKILRYTDPEFTTGWCEDNRLVWDGFCGGDQNERCKQAFLDHNDRVREVAGPGQLLEYRAGDGWGPLCEFLDVPEPEGPYPYINPPASFIEAHNWLWKNAVRRSIRNVSLVVGSVGLLAYVYRLRSR